MSIEVLIDSGVWVLVGGWFREKLYVFAGSLLGATMLDGGTRERSDVKVPHLPIFRAHY